MSASKPSRRLKWLISIGFSRPVALAERGEATARRRLLRLAQPCLAMLLAAYAVVLLQQTFLHP
jgi:hypothetical protein